MKWQKLTPALALAACFGLGCGAFVHAGEEPARPAPSGPWYEDDEVFIRIVLRSPQQLTAFYLGRGFNQAAIDQILDTCFVTPVIHNKSLPLLWLNLDRWQFLRGSESIPRIKRDYWPEKWDTAALPQAQRSTFGWTLMPERRDLRLDEGVGGSVVIPRQTQPFTLVMNFPTSNNANGPVKRVVFEAIQCVNQESRLD